MVECTCTVLTIFRQINVIKERVKAVTTLERDITKYFDEGKDEYKEVLLLLLSFFYTCVLFSFVV